MQENQLSNNLVFELKEIIREAKSQVASQVNVAMVISYWNVGHRINQEVLQNKRAKYGKEIFYHISLQLTIEYGNSFSEKNLRKMMKFANVFSDFQIVASAMRQIEILKQNFITSKPFAK